MSPLICPAGPVSRIPKSTSFRDRQGGFSQASESGRAVRIAREQLNAWAQRGDPVRAWYSFKLVKDALQHESLRGLQCDIYAQGSYANETNIADDSDVDIVLALQSAFYADTNDLPPPETTAYRQAHQPSDITWEAFRELAVPILKHNFVATAHSKCVRVSSGLIRLPADVLICVDFRHYREFEDLGHQQYDEGVLFYVNDRAVINHPKQHIAICGAKDSGTSGMFKKIVRITKNARNRVLDDWPVAMNRKTAPSYFIECLLWNVPDTCYLPDLGDAYQAVIDWLTTNRGNLAELTCPNGMNTLFGTGPDTSWNEQGAHTLIDALHHQLWSG